MKKITDFFQQTEENIKRQKNAFSMFNFYGKFEQSESEIFL